MSLLRQHHDALDRLVAQAYGWGADWVAGTLTDEWMLDRLVQLDRHRSTEEKGGPDRWLRPSWQAPGQAAPTTADLDLGEAPRPAAGTVVPWPATLQEQVGAVRSILAATDRPLATGDVARQFRGRRATTVRPLLDALAGLGLARRLGDGRDAA